MSVKSLLLFIGFMCMILSVKGQTVDQVHLADDAQLLIAFREGVAPEAALSAWLEQSVTLRYGRLISRPLNIHLFYYDPANYTAEELLAWLSRQPQVAVAQYNDRVYPRAEPNDPLYNNQWDLELMQAPAVWDVTTGGLTARGDTIVVAILDSGFYEQHPDLRPNLWHNRAEILGDGIDNDGNGYVDDDCGWNFITQSPVHSLGTHGTSAAGIIGARGNNEQGVTGVNWQMKLMLMDIARVGDIIAAYEYIIDQRDRYNKTMGAEGALVVATNASFGQEQIFCEQQPLWGAMYDRLGQVGVLTGAGTANHSWDVEERGDMPTTCASEFIITTLNVTQNDRLAGSSAYGRVSIDLGSPGDDSYTVRFADDYGLYDGNSAAAPHLTGAIALLYSLPCEGLAEDILRRPAETARYIRQAILQGVAPLADLANKTVTGGRLNVFNSLQIIQEDCGNTTGDLAFLRFFPNPVSDELTVVFESPNFDPFTFEVYNALGQRIWYQEVLTPRFGPKQFYVPVYNWSSGVYVGRLRQGKTAISRSFVVQP